MSKISPIGRVSFPSVFRPNEFDGKKSFSVTLIFDKNADLSEMEKAIEEAIKKKWPDQRPKNLDLPIRDGDQKEQREYHGKKYVTFKSNESRPPQVVNADKSTITESSGYFYAGCYARVSWNVYAWEKAGKRGVSFGLGNIQKAKDGDPFDGRTSAEDDFASLGEVADGSGMF